MQIGPTQMRICLYIPCHNGEATLPEVFQAIRGQVRAPDEVVLVNDRSTDKTVELASRAGWNVVHTQADRPGLAAARNRAVEYAIQAGCDVLAGIDADAVPAPDYVREMADLFATHHVVVGVCGNMQERFRQSPSDLWRAIYMRQHYGDQYLSNPPILYGSSAAYRLAVLSAMGGFDESLRTNFEDTEFTQRLLAAGHQVAYSPMLRLEHLKRDTPDSVLRMFWNWYRPGAERAGHFGSIDVWLRQRLPWIWHDFRTRMRSDEAVSMLSALTLALPWTQVLRDMRLIDARLGVASEGRPLIDMATDLLSSVGFDDRCVGWVQARMECVLDPAVSGEPAPVDPALVAHVRDHAAFAIPRRSYWDEIAVSVRHVLQQRCGQE